MKNKLLTIITSRFVVALGTSMLVMVASCTEQLMVSTPSNNMEVHMSADADYVGKLFYDHVKMHALEDPLGNSNIPVEDQKKLRLNFDDLKNSGDINFASTLSKAVNEKKISQIVKTILIDYNTALLSYINQNPDADKCFAWCIAQENALYKRSDINTAEKIMIGRHQAMLRYYVRFTLESQSQFIGQLRSRVSGGSNDILCYIGCAINNISAFSAVGQLASHAGAIIGASVGLIYTIVNSASCGCNTSNCGAATAVSTPDVCYSASQGLVYSAWGYGPSPWEFVWNFYREDLSNSPVVRNTNVDHYTLTNSELNGASKVAVRLTSNCSGSYYYSIHYWTAPSDNGKPKPVVYANQDSGVDPDQIRYVVYGTNVDNIVFNVPTGQATILDQTSNSVTVKWEPDARIGIEVITSSSCSSTTAYAY